MRILITVLIVTVLVSACGGGESQPTATQVATEVDTVAPTSTTGPSAPTTQPMEAPAPPTQGSEAATATLAATDPPRSTATDASAPVAEGSVSFRDSLAIADQLVLTMRNIAPPPDGFVYEGWFINDDGGVGDSTGVLEVKADGSVDFAWTSPTGDNLVAQYAGFSITVEPANDAAPNPSNEVAFRGTAAPDVLAAARRVFAVNDGEPATPRNVSYGQGLRTQSQVAKDHVLNSFNAAAIGAFAETRVHAEHVINIIEGTGGSRYADYNGDGRAENPGDGFGTLTYARQIAVLLPGLSGDLSDVESLLIGIQDVAEQVTASTDVASAKPLLNELKTMGERLMNETTPTFYAAAQAAVSYTISPAP